MPFDIDVFASGLSHRVECHKDRTLIVTTYRDRMEVISKFSKQLPQPFGLSTAIRQRDVLSLH